MVYCGKPSRGCAPCRAKRTKCDLKLPTCSQCTRTGRLCTGYRHLDGTEIRENSRSTEQRLQSLLLPADTSAPSVSYHDQPPDLLSDGQWASYSPSPQNLLSHTTPLAEEGAVQFFFEDYVLEDTRSPSNLHDCLPRLYKRADSDSALSKVVTALGMTCLAQIMQAPEIMTRANLKYAESLQRINSALRHPIQAKHDETLLVVMLLGLYEEHNITIKSMEPWTNHVKGALALLDYRGHEQLGNEIGLQLIRSLRTQVMVNCLVRRVDVPETLLKWSRLAREYENDHQVSESELGDIMAKFCNLQSAIEWQTHDSDPSIFVSTALNIDSELADWAARWECSEQHATIIVQEQLPGIFKDYWYLYPTIMAAMVCDHYRCMRVLVNQIIVTQLGYMTADLDPELVAKYSSVCIKQLDSSKCTIIELSHEICASIPYYLDQYPGEQAVNFSSSKDAATRNARAKLALWPLYVAGQTECIPGEMRTWVVDQLDSIAAESGTHKIKAKGLARLLRQKQRAIGEDWRKLGFASD